MPKFAGLDLNSINIDRLTWEQIKTIHTAFINNYQASSGEIDFSPVLQIIRHLRSYLKIGVVEISAIYCLEGAQEIPEDYLRLCLALRFLPSDSNDPLIVQARKTVDKLPGRFELATLQQESFALGDILEVWDIIKDNKEEFNSTGFWEKSARELLFRISEEHFDLAHTGVATLANTTNASTFDLALQTIFCIELVYYLHKRINRPDYRVFVGRYEDEFGLKQLYRNVFALLQQHLKQIRAMADKQQATTVTPYKELLFRARDKLASFSLPLRAKSKPRIKLNQIHPE